MCKSEKFDYFVLVFQALELSMLLMLFENKISSKRMGRGTPLLPWLQQRERWRIFLYSFCATHYIHIVLSQLSFSFPLLNALCHLIPLTIYSLSLSLFFLLFFLSLSSSFSVFLSLFSLSSSIYYFPFPTVAKAFLRNDGKARTRHSRRSCVTLRESIEGN